MLHDLTLLFPFSFAALRDDDDDDEATDFDEGFDGDADDFDREDDGTDAEAGNDEDEEDFGIDLD